MVISEVLWYADLRRQVWLTLALSKQESVSQITLSQLVLTSKHLTSYLCKNAQVR